MKDIHYAFCVARIRALENKLLTKQDIASLIGQKDYSAALGFLKEKGFAEEGESLSQIITRQTQQLNTLLDESVPDKKELDALYLLNDYFNLKVIVKCAVEKKNADGLLLFPTTIDFSSFDYEAADGEFTFLKSEYRNAAKEAYSIALKSSNGKFSDIIIDTAAINTLSDFAKGRNSGMLGKICGFIADTANIKTALRCVSTFQDSDYIKAAIGNCFKLDKEKLVESALSGEEALSAYLEASDYKEGYLIYKSNASAFEKWCDDNVMKIASDAVYTSFGFDPVVYYYYRKSLEIKTVRMILTAIRSDVDRSIIKERVRELYA